MTTTSSVQNVLTLDEVAEYLRVAPKTVLRMARRGELPSAKVGGQWRFVRQVIDSWLHEQMTSTPASDLGRLLETDAESVPLSRLLRPELMVFDVQSGDKRHVLGQLVAPLKKAGLLTDEAGYLDQLLAREAMLSTGLGGGIALPHLRHPGESPLAGPCIVLGRSRVGIDFAALDKEPVYLILLLCSNRETVHLRLLTRVAGWVEQDYFVNACLDAATPAELMASVLRMERSGAATPNANL